MGRQEGLESLGLEAGATREEIEAVIQRAHPSSGESAKEAASRNRTPARDVRPESEDSPPRESGLPSSVWTGLTGQYLSLVGPCTEAPAEFNRTPWPLLSANG